MIYMYVCFKGFTQSWPPASDATRSSKNYHHCFFDACGSMPHLSGGATLPPMTAPELISYLESLNAVAFCHKQLQMPRPWLVKLMTASLRGHPFMTSTRRAMWMSTQKIKIRVH